MSAGDSLNQEQFFYHGTTREGLDAVKPAVSHGRGVVFPHDTDKSFAYATPDESNAWDYAEKAWHATGTGIPRVYKVAPLGPHEPDPETDAQGRMRSNFSGDVRSRHGFSVLNEVQMPEHMGSPEDWR